ncbi:MAG: phosphonate ABC transporter ATP-binding protein [Gallionella sp.]|nr:phosphonate ABC transporter ATP-binding protein [Gallionella sp.]MDP1940397.1 phosphonate ABC transporter ATP-binding protein [Gallionella sp.]
MAKIIIKDIGKRYANGFEALKGVSAEIAAGSFTVILGPSGAGKSTLLRTINGLETPTAGSIQIGEQVVTQNNLREVRSQVGMVFQHFNLVDRLSVMTNVLTGRLSHRSWLGSLLCLFRRTDLDLAHDALIRVGLTEKAWNRADKLSGGQQQRVGIARALAQQPRVILADEPVASLDPVASEEIMGLLREICTRDGITVVVNLHQVELAKRFADRIIGLNDGLVVYDGPASGLDRVTLSRIYSRNGDQVDEQLETMLAYA